jgi:hypothetical protein
MNSRYACVLPPPTVPSFGNPLHQKNIVAAQSPAAIPRFDGSSRYLPYPRATILYDELSVTSKSVTFPFLNLGRRSLLSGRSAKSSLLSGVRVVYFISICLGIMSRLLPCSPIAPESPWSDEQSPSSDHTAPSDHHLS